MKPLAIIALLLMLGACAGTTETRATNALAIACQGYAAIGQELLTARRAGKLSAENIGRVDTANDIIRPVCSEQSAVVDPATAVGVVEGAIGVLKQVKSSF